MPNYDGLSDEERRRHQAAHEKLSRDFAKAHAGAPTPPSAPEAQKANPQRVMKTLIRTLTPDGQTRLTNTAAGARNEAAMRRAVEKYRADAAKKAEKEHKKMSLKNEFNKGKGRLVTKSQSNVKDIDFEM